MQQQIAPLPKRVQAAFEDRTWLTLRELANAFEFSESTVRRHANDGTLPAHRKGTGRVKVHRAFTLRDVQIFWRRLHTPAPPKARQPRKNRAIPAGIAK